MSCKHGNWDLCDECKAEDDLWDRAYKAGYEEGGKVSIDLTLKHLKRAEQAEAALKVAQFNAQPQNPCCCVADGDDGTVAHLCEWHKAQFGKAYRMQNVADTLTVENIAKLPEDKLRLFIAHGIQESTARKQAESRNRRLVELLKNIDLSQQGMAGQHVDELLREVDK